MVAMKHLKTRPDSRENSSCGSDIDRQELIDNYGSEKYLRKWNVDVDDDNHDTDDNDHDGGVAPREVLHEQIDEHKQSENDNDAASLVSYNSVRDAGTPVNNTPSYLPYQIQPTAQHITLWQGYSGNIYFDPLRCQPMRINSSKPHMQKLKDSKSYRKTKSCSPSMEVLAANHYISSSASSFYSLGSLRFASKDEKRRNTSCISHHGRLHKRWSDAKATEPGHNHHRVRCESAPESLVISGGHLKNVTSDPIDHVLKHNIKTSLTSKSKNNFPSLVVGHTCESERGTDKQDNQSSTSLPPVESIAPSKEVTEPKPVFIIPFGALDDPVEGQNNNKLVGDTTSKRNSNKKIFQFNDAALLNDRGVDVHTGDCNEPELALSITAPLAKRDEKSTAQRVGRTNDVNATARREISDSSLSNYLQAMPTHLSKQKKMVPKLSYTKRTMDMVPGSMSSMNYSITDSDLRISSTTALYGGYLPSTRTTDTQLYRVERNSASQTGETNSLGSQDEQRLSNTKPRKRNSSKNTPKSKHCQESDKCQLPVIGGPLS
ncbi:uncharacterized protein LOC116305856 [Actinia tenebrosa]|uniref:Uncharacterized protein LOC116305856 n=1 Tax=Actinia tenebrosa TaxID=6105 RepID=A0A6P8IWD7_ACTTE|nr:uncharacterized protein LOC116305856 [Actinia tenebrosa]XP_031571694.1 uncharacterized protein LOC116305856 [Actinia tenebrosa]XP_031571696.1 uncharacterized protein LOC116305856 [Actinia tenebrosa]